MDKICEALAPLGSDYVGIMKEGLLDKRWVDRYENKGKRSGAYSSGCYDSNPFILMNYLDDNINSVYTLAHEAGHSMHSYFSNQNQPYVYADYTIFVAEVASTFNEALLTRYFLSQDINRDMRIYLISREIDNIRGTLIRQTMFAEFEHQIYQAAESGQPMTVEAFQEIYKPVGNLFRRWRRSRSLSFAGVFAHSAFLFRVLRLQIRHRYFRRLRAGKQGPQRRRERN